MDCLAVAALLRVVPGSLAEILAPSVKVVAGGNSYDVKEILKAAQVQVGRRQQDLAQDGAGRRRRAGRQARDGIPQGSLPGRVQVDVFGDRQAERVQGGCVIARIAAGMSDEKNGRQALAGTGARQSIVRQLCPPKIRRSVKGHFRLDK